MRKIKVDGMDAILLLDDLALIVDVEEECVIVTRFTRDAKGELEYDPNRGYFEIPIKLRDYARLQAAETELEALVAALAV
ncbi:hypothetical protein [Paenibacillus ehimensis]|uniref:DUF3006 domain-containing protein n=1 Tax=Paenibacillus ehimensis TaxID=79264 RepID=A0ABT8VMN8_9BACL|nr:hypothetical protein [Paenibacillus ehimensis]MDO3682216.1 hypothetical protein [Paenibacillus ehimensis]